MLNFQRLQEMVTLSSIELLEIVDYHEFLQKNTHDFESAIKTWLKKYNITCDEDTLEVMLPEYFTTIISGNYGYDFYVIQYRQAMHWRLCGLTQSKSLLLISHIRKLLILYSEKVASHNLAKGLCHVLDMSQSIVATVYQISDEVERMRFHAENELKRIKRSFGLLSMEPPQALIQPFLDHLNWKFNAFSAALGERNFSEEIEISHTKCRLARWLAAEGEGLIPEKELDKFHHSHKRIHQLGALAIEHSDLKQPEKVVELLNEMEVHSQVVSETLLNVIEEEFIRLATSDVLTGMPNKRSFELEFSKNIAFAERHNYWVGLVLIDVDYFKKVNDTYGHLIGDKVLKEISELITETARTEETTYRWGGEEFAVVTLDKQPGGAESLAERIRKAVEIHSFCANSNHPLSLSVSCGSICFQPPCEQPNHELFALVDKQLYEAKNSGRNCIVHKTLD
ncbi:sensor domain-containing diguanylate cyclase [Thiomicrorhabdus indica]|uniref:sensor domain-containing diguanylate cyclase n=1 Tax=Thiomicrorhabdus indica TaxID=2267253 RepID=UPI002AA8FEAF|nr:sensor domain-containing diguanylate cyclase [Thiomicrorhabdus indica]